MTALLAWIDHPFSASEYFWMYLLGGLVVVCLTFALGEGCTLILLLAAATLTWAASQGTSVAWWQAGGLWLGWYSTVSVIAAITRRVRIRRWRQARMEIGMIRADFERRGRNFDREMAEAGLRIANRDWRRRCIGLDKD